MAMTIKYWCPGKSERRIAQDAVCTVSLLLLLWPMWAAGQVRVERDPVMPGIDVLRAEDFKPIRDMKVGLITNPTGVTSQLESTVDVLHKAPQVQLAALFGPEHGVRGDVFAGEHVGDARDAKTGVPVFSLYGKTRKPTPEILGGLDALVFDIQDIGSRSYTYISTLGEAMEAAAEQGIAFIVLDRPNPLTGERIEGRPLDPAFASFVGKYPIPYVHGLTVGELARMINGEGWLAGGVKCKLTVIAMRGYSRRMWFDETGLPWVLTSPHIPRADVAMFYAATGIMGELQVVSEGVGYTLPFELAGAPFISDAGAFADELNRRKLPGVYFRPMHFKPYYIDRVKGQDCGGVQIHIVDRDKAELTAIQFHVMDAVRKLYPQVDLFSVKGRAEMFDKVCGTDRIRVMFQAGKSVDEITGFWHDGREAFRRDRHRYLIYDR